MGKNKASATGRDASSGATTKKTTKKTTTTMKMKTGGGGSTTIESDVRAVPGARSSGDSTTTNVNAKTSRAVEEDDFDVDALFGNAKKKRKSEKRPEGRDGAVEETRVRVLLPGQKKPKQKRTTPEFVPVEKARRFEDGLPVYKSYGDFTDMRHGQEGAGVDEKGRKLGPNGEPAGDCPFDCWCCF